MKILKWYKEKIFKSPFITVISSVVALVITIGSFVAGINTIVNSYEYINSFLFAEKEAYEIIDNIKTGVLIDTVEAKIGKPILKDNLPETLLDFEKRVYFNPFFILQIINNKESKIVFYSITTISEKFKPKLLYPFNYKNEFRLGKQTFKEIIDDNSVLGFIIGIMKFPYYSEEYYFGNPGGYKIYFLGYSPFGLHTEDYDYLYTFSFNFKEIKNEKFGYKTLNEGAEQFYNEKENGIKINLPDIVKEAREILVPNTMGVGDIDAPELLLKYLFDGEDRLGVGIDYWDAGPISDLRFKR